MTYDYTNGDGVSKLNPNYPAGTSPYIEIAPALRQIKKYLNDPIAGPHAKLVAVQTLLQGLKAQSMVSGTIPIGTIMFAALPRTKVISGWKLCDGSAVSRTEFSSLFNAISTRFGAGNNIDTFNLPKVFGRAIAGNDKGANLLHTVPQDPASNNYETLSFHYIGQEKVQLTKSNHPEHVHAAKSYGSYTVDRMYFAKPGTQIGYGDIYGYKKATKISSVGGNQPHNNMQPSLVLNAFIKVK